MSLAAIGERIRSEQSGFTMVELLVVMIISIIVVLALMTYQDMTLRQTTRIFAKVDATQQGRVAMESLENKLHSSCVAEGVTPILAGSTATSLSFVSKFGSAASLTPEKHTVTLNANGTLTDTTYAVSGGSSPNWTFSSTATTTVTLLTNASQNGATPVFRYYAYGIAKDGSGNNYLDAASQPYMILLDGTATLPTGVTTSTGGAVAAGTLPANSGPPLTVPLSTTDARITSAIAINLVVGAAGKLGTNTTIADAPLTVSNSVVLRLTPVPSEGNLPTVPPCA
jgi:Tfp pilus assembly protein PilV